MAAPDGAPVATISGDAAVSSSQAAAELIGTPFYLAHTHPLGEGDLMKPCFLL